MRDAIIQALEDRYNAQISEADATLKIYLENSVGIGEHPQHIDEVDKLIEKIATGKFDFTKLICTPAMMSKIGKHGKVLGPKGLMPNPKLGSVSENVKQAVTDAKSGQVEIRNDKDGNIGVSIGKKSFHDDQLLKNYHAILDTLEKEKGNNTLKGDLIKSFFLTSSMGVSYKIKLGKLI